MKGAFKTPTVREVKRTAPYFHDGSAKSLRDCDVTP
jgi:cytochrome c peroxidase